MFYVGTIGDASNCLLSRELTGLSDIVGFVNLLKSPVNTDFVNSRVTRRVSLLMSFSVCRMTVASLSRLRNETIQIKAPFYMQFGKKYHKCYSHYYALWNVLNGLSRSNHEARVKRETNPRRVYYRERQRLIVL
ncbi:hypothetical protein RND81_04G106600 [Saponaria officinalis]|uniref:Uncharacterized protein n=1 Tax=Saponaria officinalis TaxID=3572 RepID=A0AAW1LKQ3_SAPOF